MTTRQTAKIRKRSWLVSVLLTIALGNVVLAQDQTDDPPPIDHAKRAKAGREALKKGQYKLAVEELGTAIKAARSRDADDKKAKAGYFYDLGRAYLEWIKNDKQLTQAQKRDFLIKCLGSLRQATTLDRAYLDPHKTLYDIYWQFSYAQMRQRRAVDWTQFIEAAGALIDLDPDNATAYYRRGVAWGNVGQQTANAEAWRKGLADFRKAIALDSDNIDYWRAWLMLMQWAGPRDVKIDVDAGFAESFKANPNSAALRILYASHLRKNDRSDEAKEQLQAAIKCEPTSPRGHIALARFLAGSQRYDAALKALKAAAAIDPALAEIYLQRSKIHRAARKLDLAVKVLQEGVAALKPKLSAVAATQPASRRTRSLTEQMNRLNFALANAVLDLRRTISDKKQQAAMAAIARECFKKLDNLPANSPHRAKLAGRLAIISGDSRTAIKNLEQAYRAFGLADLQTPALLITLYDAAGMPGKSEKLLTSLRNAPRLQDNVQVLLALARLKIRYQDYKGADSYVNRALTADAKNKAALQLQTELQLLMGKEVSAAQAGTISAAGVRAMVEQADSKWADGKRKEALATIARLRKAMPGNLLLAERIINMHLLLDDKPAARAVLKEMRTAWPDNENLKFQAELIDKNPDERLAMQLARVDKKVTDPFVRAWAKARIASRAGNKQMHNKFLAEAVALKPDTPGITAVQFRTALQNKNWDAALAVARRVEKTNELRGKSMRSELLVRQGRHVQAIRILVSLRKSNPDSKFILRMLGECYLATQKIDMAEDVFGVLESNDPGDVSALIGLAIVTQRQGRSADNEDYVMRAYRKPAGRKHLYISRRYLEIRESKATGDEIKKIIERREEIYKLGVKDPDYLNNLERLARLCEYRTRDLKRAEELYKEACEKTAHSLRWGRTLAFFHARNGESAKGEAVLKTGIREARNTSDRVAWLVMHGDFLTMYDPAQALRAYNQAATIDPENPLPFRAKAALYAKAGRWAEAIEHMTAYVARRGEDIRGRKTLIQYRINGRQYDRAEKELEALLSRNPTDAQAMLLKAVLLRLRGRPAKSVIVATRAIEKHPEFAPALSVRARGYLVMGELEMAALDLEAARKISRTPKISMELADVYARLGRDDDATGVLKSVVAEHKTHEEALYKLIDTYIQAKDWPNAEGRLADAHKRFPEKPVYWIVEAGMRQRRKQSAEAVAALEKAFELDKESMPVVRAYLLGLVEAKAYNKALAVADSYKDKAPRAVWVNAVRGRIMVAQKQDAKANELFLKSVEHARPDELPFVVLQIREAYGPKIAIERMAAWSKQRPTDWYAKVLVGNLCGAAVSDPDGKLTTAERSRYTRLAIDSYVAAIKKARKPEDVAMLSNRLAKAYYDAGKPREAERFYLKCLEITPDNHAALNNLAYLYVDDLDKPEKALPYVRQVLRYRPRDANVLDTYGWVLARLKRYAEAKTHLQRAIERDPGLAAGRYHLGWVFEQTGDLKQAMKQYRLAMEAVRTKTHLPIHRPLKESIERVQKKLKTPPASK